MPDVPESSPLPEKDLKYTPRQRDNQTVVPIGRTPPNDLAAEQGVLGCILLDTRQNLPACIEKVKDETVFYDLRHQAIYAAMVSMYEANAPIDLLTLSHQLRTAGELDNIGGVAYLTELQDSVPSAANLEYYFEIVRDQALLRRMIQTCTKAIADAYDETGEVDRLVGEVEQAVLAINRDHNITDMPTIVEHVQDAVGKIEMLFKNKGSTTGVETGFADLDRMTTGLHPGEMIVVAARPSMGKTSLAMNIVEHVALNLQLPVGVFSLEMSSESLVMRMISSLARINSHEMQEGMLTPRDFPRIHETASRLAKSALHIDDTAGLSILQLSARARRMWQQHDIKLFVIDYLQLLHSTSRRAGENRQQEIAEISSGIKAMAKTLGVPVIVLSQLNRELEKDKNRKPRLSDLRESGSIEQDADLVGLLYKPGGVDEDTDDPDSEARPVNLLIAKQRNGPTGDVPLTFLKGYTRFENAAKFTREDMPQDD
ncbi:MAG: replicative DNA helicase [Verrucomicrobiales bacterium]|nr:replicative DNA helicase [Verrucomicrobiales bacterium]